MPRQDAAAAFTPASDDASVGQWADSHYRSSPLGAADLSAMSVVEPDSSEMDTGLGTDLEFSSSSNDRDVCPSPTRPATPAPAAGAGRSSPTDMIGGEAECQGGHTKSGRARVHEPHLAATSGSETSIDPSVAVAPRVEHPRESRTRVFMAKWCSLEDSHLLIAHRCLHPGREVRRSEYPVRRQAFVCSVAFTFWPTVCSYKL